MAMISYKVLKIQKRKLTTKEAMIDPKNPSIIGTSLWNLGNHTLAICIYTLFSICCICKLQIGE